MSDGLWVDGDHDQPDPAPDTPATKAEDVDTSGVVTYVGSADVKELDAAAWRGVGVEDQRKTVWTAANDHMVALGDLNEDALAYLETQTDFKIG